MCLFWGFVKIQKADLHKNLYDFGCPGQKNPRLSTGVPFHKLIAEVIY